MGRRRADPPRGGARTPRPHHARRGRRGRRDWSRRLDRETDQPIIPFPGWDFFDDEDVADLDPQTRERTAPRALSIPTRVTTDAIALTDDRRYAVPVTVLSGHRDDAEFRRFLAQWGPFADEFTAIADTEVVRLGTGHWPQFSQPERLGEALVAAIQRAG
ncbi:alpha/beta fold hydrolase [Microbacterium aurum]